MKRYSEVACGAVGVCRVGFHILFHGHITGCAPRSNHIQTAFATLRTISMENAIVRPNTMREFKGGFAGI
jgi:hypothetical protein